MNTVTGYLQPTQCPPNRGSCEEKKSDWAMITVQKRSRSMVFYENSDGLVVFVIRLFGKSFLKHCGNATDLEIYFPLVLKPGTLWGW